MDCRLSRTPGPSNAQIFHVSHNFSPHVYVMATPHWPICSRINEHLHKLAPRYGTAVSARAVPPTSTDVQRRSSFIPNLLAHHTHPESLFQKRQRLPGIRSVITLGPSLHPHQFSTVEVVFCPQIDVRRSDIICINAERDAPILFLLN